MTIYSILLYIHIHTGIHACARTHTCTHTYTHTHIQTHVATHTHTQTHCFGYMYRHKCSHTCTHRTYQSFILCSYIIYHYMQYSLICIKRKYECCNLFCINFGSKALCCYRIKVEFAPSDACVEGSCDLNYTNRVKSEMFIVFFAPLIIPFSAA